MGKYILKKIGLNKTELSCLKYDDLVDADRAFADSVLNNDGKCLYIVLLDKPKKRVVRICGFENKEIAIELRDGDIVSLREEFCEPGESKNLYTVTDINENTGRCLIISLNSRMPIASSESVGLEMIETVSHIPPLE